MRGESEYNRLVGLRKYFVEEAAEPSGMMINKAKGPLAASFVVSDKEPVHIPSDPVALPHKSEGVINNDTSQSSTHSIASGDTIASSTRDTVVVMITLTIILLTLIATYFLWRKRRSSFSSPHCNRLEEYRYSRLSQNDVEVDNISFQGDLTHKSLLNTAPVCADEDGDDDRMKPATLCLEYDSLITISKEEKHENQGKTLISQASSKSDTTTPAMLIGELSDEDLLQ